MAGRTIIAANRVPYSGKFKGRQLTLERSVGGLATGLRGVHDSSDSLWIGSLAPEPGQPKSRQRKLVEELEKHSVTAIPLTQREQEGFYESVANGVLWPLFHSHLDQLPLQVSGWNEYRTVNAKFAAAIAEAYRPGDMVWVHDYQLMLLPRLVRDLVPEARIGFFLHIPFPSPDIFKALPWREEVLEGLLGADLVGFHVPLYMANFVACVREIAGFENDVDDIVVGERSVRTGVFPLGVDSEFWESLGVSPEVEELVEINRAGSTGTRLIVGIDRLDYTKGIPLRLLALDTLLEKRPDLRGSVRMVQVSVPSREEVESYMALRSQVDELVGRINGRWGSASWVPVHHIYRSLGDKEIAALYRSADIMVVTPVRDGMNLVAKEFVATRVDGDGVLVLSEFAGAASELGAAFRVNPFDIDGSASVLGEALSLRMSERRRRMKQLRGRVQSQTAGAWAEQFIEALNATPSGPTGLSISPEHLANVVVTAAKQASALHIVLDYDGTLVSFAPTPPEAAPDLELLELLTALSSMSNVKVDVVSGRSRADLEVWLSTTGVGLYAEHGSWARPRGAEGWVRLGGAHEGWRPGVERLLAYFLETTPGSLWEAKGSSIAWHHRGSDREATGHTDFGEMKARELRATLSPLLAGTPAHAVPGNKVVEIVGSGATKGIATARAAADNDSSTVIIAIGDDRTDEDMFRALPDDGFTVKVRGGPTRAKYRFRDVDEVRVFLNLLVRDLAVPKKRV